MDQMWIYWTLINKCNLQANNSWMEKFNPHCTALDCSIPWGNTDGPKKAICMDCFAVDSSFEAFPKVNSTFCCWFPSAVLWLSHKFERSFRMTKHSTPGKITNLSKINKEKRFWLGTAIRLPAIDIFFFSLLGPLMKDQRSFCCIAQQVYQVFKNTCIEFRAFVKRATSLLQEPFKNSFSLSAKFLNFNEWNDIWRERMKWNANSTVSTFQIHPLRSLLQLHNFNIGTLFACTKRKIGRMFCFHLSCHHHYHHKMRASRNDFSSTQYKACGGDGPLCSFVILDETINHGHRFKWQHTKKGEARTAQEHTHKK